MPEPAPNAELMRSLGRLVRGLSALFWGLPLTLLACYYTAKAETLRSLGILPPLVSTGWLVFGLSQLGAFQKQERIWRKALDLAQIVALVDFGLSPFLYWSNKIPNNVFFSAMVLVMTASGLGFLVCLNLVLQRLGAMLPDETLRLDTKQFTSLNFNLLLATFILCVAYVAISHLRAPPLYLQAVQLVLERGSNWLLILLVLLPLAMTMALLWKTKEVILEGVFSGGR